ncbi:DUF192 domain-containing protein [Sabulilitoribacter arenilitoris]|uniref:DUF192 domain-containing protein n=1 Tax=Wocania arenilitoris TaxID=2044858 RepID=A0AAE3JL28_9FLAO|nr:DUF192 domain-containing protein [Wocania arenilitoris]MCF7567727.1 DUF192 domain-containing protein [Wocania arenilitoris]
MCFKALKLFSLILITISITACKNDKKVIKQTKVIFTKEGDLTLFKTTTDSTQIVIDIEIADTEYETQTGLMYRNSMQNNQGMLFVFNDVSERSFYMKNTKIPLDIIFINDNNTIVSFQKNAKPLDESSLPSNAPAKYVLEVNAGLVDTWKLSVGDSISYTN